MAYNSISIKPYIKSHLELQREITPIELPLALTFLSKVFVLHIWTCLQGLVENPAMTLQVIKKTKRDGRTDGHTHARTTWKQYTPPQTKFAGGIIKYKENNTSVHQYGGIDQPSAELYSYE